VRVYLAYAVAIALAVAIAIQPAAAITALGIPFISSYDFVYTQPFSVGSLTILEFNSFNARSLDFETTDIDFPVFDRFCEDGISNDLAPGSTQIATDDLAASANVLPFGPVNLAFPSISQTVLQQAEYDRTYFFIDSISE